ncbi:DUF305 domain-containing protein [Actinomarinicola tropica]|uniref:DUF305 domain-containing protein n=1 Tax=Actinomarinicola tropica TaxID=2789776 RepID=A0A5Q2RPB4_9ACTN|nr:DUF305 domain-containing protein [Actinomarinicola tropica]QGG96276.1 DUF305 domain-containing protein [Actinomarinicola tropica]
MTAVLRLRSLLVLVAAAVLFTACGDDSGDDSTQPTPVEQDGAGGSEGTEPNQADIEFTRAMIVHHEQAIEMSALAEDRAEAEEVRGLATRIGEAQQPEIDRMQEWLEAWGEDAADAGTGMDHDGMEMGDGNSMGMMSGDDMEQLEAANGPEFDRAFLEMMIEHHRGAIAMAQDVLTEGSHPAVLALADGIVSDQEAEVEEIERLLAGLDT